MKLTEQGDIVFNLGRQHHGGPLQRNFQVTFCGFTHDRCIGHRSIERFENSFKPLSRGADRAGAKLLFETNYGARHGDLNPVLVYSGSAGAKKLVLFVVHAEHNFDPIEEPVRELVRRVFEKFEDPEYFMHLVVNTPNGG